MLNNPDEGAREDALLDGGYNGFNPALECVMIAFEPFMIFVIIIGFG